MQLLANSEAESGIFTAAEMLLSGQGGLTACVEGISLVERDPGVRSVGYGGWPNILGEMEFDAAVMDGDTRQIGAVGGLKGFLSAVRVALAVKDKSQHEILVGEGAAIFAKSMGFEAENTLYPPSRETWWAKLREVLSEEEMDRFPNIDLSAVNKLITDPEKVRDTTVFLAQDTDCGLHVATSTSGWAWKHPGRLGDSPIPGAGFYADSRYGAAACTHTGEMTIRTSTARTIVLCLQMGMKLDLAIDFAVKDLLELSTGFLGGVVIHALDTYGNHRIANCQCEEDIFYWYWDDTLSQPEKRLAEPWREL
ncbi:MAG: N(4)-(beta-N-acetylglucosaminyl)-L-asparaginase [Gammaproteobacteria bacterium]|nr:N(4)-(beta-N-acetylglucosaminyl)-L-asparaginase [Gammaproteobacteria bacterium]MCY4356334.1 N(4)-(beta-N-acetylglucosaminyl)-L-asparaginase [Gammaproteobacteria bacterium]